MTHRVDIHGRREDILGDHALTVENNHCRWAEDTCRRPQQQKIKETIGVIGNKVEEQIQTMLKHKYDNKFQMAKC